MAQGVSTSSITSFLIEYILLSCLIHLVVNASNLFEVISWDSLIVPSFNVGFFYEGFIGVCFL
jgi:hypothetical protein